MPDHAPQHGHSESGLHYRRGEELGWWFGDRRATLEEIGAARPKCPNGGRHWFTVRGYVGLRKPTCDRCGAPNPAITPSERADYDDWKAYTEARRA